MTEPLTYDSDRLIREWRDRYAGLRTVAREMLEQAEILVRDAIARELEQTRSEAKTAREYDLERREKAVEYAEGRQQWRIDRLAAQLAEAQAKVDELSTRRTLMREERETVEDGTVVRLLAPTVAGYGDTNRVRPWMPCELEDVMHRLRMGGADEGTEVRFKRDAIEACIPFAEFALVPAKPDRPAPGPNPVVPSRALALDWRLVAGLILLVSAALLGVVVLR